MSGLSPEARDLFERARQGVGPTEAERAALLSRIETRIAPSPVLSPAAPAVPKLVVVGGGAVVLIGVALFAFEFATAATPAAPVDAPIHPVATELTVVETVVETAVENPVPVPEPETEAAPQLPAEAATSDSPPASAPRRNNARPLPRPQPPQPAQPVDDLAAELALLRAAQTARAQGQFDSALAHLSEHRSRFPRGALRVERDVALARTTCERGDLAAGRAYAAPYLSTAWGASIRESCGQDTP